MIRVPTFCVLLAAAATLPAAANAIEIKTPQVSPPHVSVARPTTPQLKTRSKITNPNSVNITGKSTPGPNGNTNNGNNSSGATNPLTQNIQSVRRSGAGTSQQTNGQSAGGSSDGNSLTGGITQNVQGDEASVLKALTGNIQSVRSHQ